MTGPLNEFIESDERRLEELMSLELLDSEAEVEFDHVVKLVAEITGCPVSLISLVDRDRQWFKAKVGLEVCETPRDNSFCDTAIKQGETFVVPDTHLDERFKNNPLVVNPPHIRFYAAQPLLTSNGFRIGTLCAIDQKPRELNSQQLSLLSLLAKQTMRLMELRLANRRLNEMKLELEEARDLAERANRAKTFFLANMSHEIRTPLGAILGFADLLGERETSEAERIQFLETIRRNGKSLTTIIDDILDLAKVESGKLNFEFLDFPLEGLLGEVCETFRQQARAKGIDLECETPAVQGLRVVSDPTRLRQILFNLVGNAVKFTEIGGITVAVERAVTDGELVDLAISVTDTGIGIKPDQRDHLFKPFTQADASTKRNFGGTGLGLALSKKLAQGLGGDLDYEGTKSGAKFVLRLRTRIAAGSDLMVNRTRARADTSALNGRRFLVVDDSEDNLYLTKRMLEVKGARVDVAASGAEAIDRCATDDYDAVLMDIQMPKMDGFEATGILRAKGFHKPIIAVTAHAMKEDEMRTRAAGCNAHIAKPLNSDKVWQTIASQFHT